MRAHVRHHIGDQLDVVFDGHDHIGESRGATWPHGIEKIGKAVHRQAQVVERPAVPFFLDADAAAATQIQLHQGAGHGVKTSGQDQDVEFVLAVGHTQPVGRDLVNGLLTDVHQLDVGAVEGVVVAGVHTQPLATNELRG